MGGVVTVRFGLVRSLVICGILQALGNLFFVLQAVGGHKIGYLALCVTAENITGGHGRHGSGQLYLQFVFACFHGHSVRAARFARRAWDAPSWPRQAARYLKRSGWVPFFLLTTVASLPALLLLVWIERRGATQSDRPRAIASLAGERNL